MTFGSWNKIKKGLLKAKPKKSLSDDPIETCEYDPAGYNSYYHTHTHSVCSIL